MDWRHFFPSISCNLTQVAVWDCSLHFNKGAPLRSLYCPVPSWEEMSVWSGTESPVLRTGIILAHWPVVQCQKGLFCTSLLPSPSSHGRVLPVQLPPYEPHWILSTC